jgi:hypothetical protein
MSDRRHHIPVTRSMLQQFMDADAEYQRQEAENVSPFEHHRDEGRFNTGGGNASNYIYSPSKLGGAFTAETAGAAGGSGFQQTGMPPEVNLKIHTPRVAAVKVRLHPESVL